MINFGNWFEGIGALNRSDPFFIERYTDCVNFEWDDAKNEANIKKHGIDFVDVSVIFDTPILVNLDQREEYGEDRWIGIGLLTSLVAVVVYVERDEDVIRIISARKANQNERKRYEQFLTHGLDEA